MKTIKVFEIIKLQYAVGCDDGELVCQQIINSLIATNDVIVIDFEGVTNTLYEFLNCMYGRLFETYSESELNKRIKFINYSMLTLDKLNGVREIALRYYGNK